MEAIKLDITNVHAGGPYTGTLYIGSNRLATNVILDTGSSTLAVDGHHYEPEHDADRQLTTLVQDVTYGAGWWIGAVVKTSVAVGHGSQSLVLQNVSTAITLRESRHGFGGAHGILGLAYQPLNKAYDLNEPTWPGFDPGTVGKARPTDVEPYFAQLEASGVIPDTFSFYTLRSKPHRRSADLARDPLNRGYFIFGGGEAFTDLYRGSFQAVKVVHDVYYNTNLKSLRVGNSPPVDVPALPADSPLVSNSFVDSGADGLILPLSAFQKLFGQFRAMNPEFSNAIAYAQHYDAVQLRASDLQRWPAITLVLEGESKEVELVVRPETYWQVNAAEQGGAVFSIRFERGGQQAILGLPLMNNYFCIFDRSADRGTGVIRFAPVRLPA